MDYHAITPRGSELLMRVVDGEVVIVPPPASQPPSTATTPPQEPHPGAEQTTVRTS